MMRLVLLHYARFRDCPRDARHFLTRLALVCALIPACASRTAWAGAPYTGWDEVARRVVPAIVNISVLTIAKGDEHSALGERERQVGSGFIVDPSGIIVTNKHVIAGAFRITVTLNDGTELPAKLLAAAAMTDLAVLKIKAGHPLPVLQLESEAAVHPGDPVLAVGNPLGIGTSLSSGIVSGIGRNLMKTPFDDYVQTDAAINHGNSGGPLIDTNGLVVGVDTILLTNQPNEGSNGLGFAISSYVVGYVVHHLIDPDAAPVGWIGVQLQDLSLGLANAFGMLNPRGFLISGVENGSSAQEARLHAGDVILRFGDATDQPDNPRALMRAIAKAPTGKAVTLTVWRDGQTLQVPVMVRAGPHLMEPHGSMGPAEDAVLPLPSDDLGLLLAPISPLARKQYALHDIKGVLVVAVDKQSEAYGRGLNAGDVIERVQEQAVESPEQLRRVVNATAARGHSIAVLVHSKNRTRWVALRAEASADAEAGDMMQREHVADSIQGR